MSWRFLPSAKYNHIVRCGQSALHSFVKRKIDLLPMWVRCSCASNHFSATRWCKSHGSENRFVESTKKNTVSWSIHPMPQRDIQYDVERKLGSVQYVSRALPVRSASLHAVFCFRLNQLSGHCYFNSTFQYLGIAIWVSNSIVRNLERVDERGSCANNFYPLLLVLSRAIRSA